MDKIGSSAVTTAQFYRAEYLPTEEVVAVKLVDLENATDKDIELYHQEVGLMKQLSHPNVVRCFGSFVNESRLWVVLEYHAHGSIRGLLEHITLSEADLGFVLYSLLNALSYFHESDRIHRAVEGKHILVSKSGDIRLSDFSLSTYLLKDGTRTTAHTVVGRGAWTAPEVHLSSTGYNKECDIWSFGMTAIELARGQAPWENFPIMKIAKLLEDEDLPFDSVKEFSSSFQELIQLCLQKDPEKRPSAKKLMEHKFFHKKKKKPEKWILKLDDIPPLSKRLRDKEAKLAEERLRTTSSAALLPLRPSPNIVPSPGEPGSTATEDPVTISWEFSPEGPTPAKDDEEESAVEQATREDGFSPTPSEVETPAPVPETSATATTAVSVQAARHEIPNNVPVSLHLGETPTHYVVFIRSPPDTTLNLTFEPGTMVISGSVLPLPVVEGVEMKMEVKDDFRFAVPLGDITDVSSTKEGECMVVRLGKLVAQ